MLYEEKAAEGMEWDLCILILLISGHDQLLMVFIVGLHIYYFDNQTIF